MGGNPPTPVQKELTGDGEVPYTGETIQGGGVFPLIEFSVSGGYHCNRSGLHSMLFRIAMHDNSAQCASPFKIEAERAKPRLAKYEYPWVLTILLGHLSSSLDDLKHLPKPTQMQKSSSLCSNDLAQPLADVFDQAIGALNAIVEEEHCRNAIAHHVLGGGSDE